MQVSLLSSPAGAPAQPTRRQTACSSALVPNAARLSAQVAARTSQCGAARQRGASLRVLATSAPPAAQAGTKAAGEDSGVYDVVVVGAGISGLTTAQVRRRGSGALHAAGTLLHALWSAAVFVRTVWRVGRACTSLVGFPCLLHFGRCPACSFG